MNNNIEPFPFHFPNVAQIMSNVPKRNDKANNPGSSRSVLEFFLSLFSSTATRTTCTELTYKCKNNLCISKVNPECDGQDDCEDKSDEENCGMCGSSAFKYLYHHLTYFTT